MKEITVADSRKLMVDILNDVTSFCDSHHLKYYLGYGTLIGAIRHKGFIPWDDDIDIQMPRQDYEEFICLYRQSGKYSLLTPYDQECYFMWTKVYNPDTGEFEQVAKGSAHVGDVVTEMTEKGRGKSHALCQDLPGGVHRASEPVCRPGADGERRGADCPREEYGTAAGTVRPRRGSLARDLGQPGKKNEIRPRRGAEKQRHPVQHRQPGLQQGGGRVAVDTGV